MHIEKEIAPRFENIIFDWYYEEYLAIGGYGSGKSYQAGALKIFLKALQEKRKILVVRKVERTLGESCIDLFKEIASDMNLLGNVFSGRDRKSKVVFKKSPFEFTFPNGSRIIFRGLDDKEKLKSINNVDIIWIEEASEISRADYLELKGRLRSPTNSMHIILTTNPVDNSNWIYKYFFVDKSDKGKPIVRVNPEEMYNKRTLIKNGTYYHHSTLDDNPYLQDAYKRRIEDIKNYDMHLYNVARHGRFGTMGTKVLPNFTVAQNAKEFRRQVQAIPEHMHFHGLDFGFEESYNAYLDMAVDDRTNTLYIYHEIYINHLNDSQFAKLPEMKKVRSKLNDKLEKGLEVNPIKADNEDPKAISYLRDRGYYIAKCKKGKGSRLSNTRKCKRFARIICSPKCENTIDELQNLVYKVKPNGEIVHDTFNIDPHTLSAIWYGLDKYNHIDLKNYKSNSRS